MDDSFRDDFYESQRNTVVLVGHVVADFLSLYVKHAYLNPLYNFFGNLRLSLSVYLYLLLDFSDIFALVFFNQLQLLIDVHQQKFLILRVLGQIVKERISNAFEIPFELVKQSPNP